MKNYHQNGDYMQFTAAADVSSGDLVQVGSLFGVAVIDAATGEEGTLALTGVYRLPKDAGDIDQGDPVYFSAGNVAATGATICGYAFEAAADADPIAVVKLLG